MTADEITQKAKAELGNKWPYSNYVDWIANLVNAEIIKERKAICEYVMNRRNEAERDMEETHWNNYSGIAILEGRIEAMMEIQEFIVAAKQVRGLGNMKCESCNYDDPINGLVPFKLLNCMPDEPPTNMRVCLFCAQGRTEGYDLPADKSMVFALNTIRKDLFGLGIKPYAPPKPNWWKALLLFQERK